MNTRRLAAVLATVAFAVLGCEGMTELQGSPQNQTPLDTKSQWLCHAGTSAVECTAAMPQQPGELAFYSCAVGDERAVCPVSKSLEKVDGLPALLTKYSATDKFSAMPWACLLTGAHERSCVRDLASLTGERVGQKAEPMPSGSNTAVAEYPEVPATCDQAAWEPYFAKLATYTYQKHGVDIAFPRELFDSTADFNKLAAESAEVPDNPGKPSCHDGEWEMRNDAWYDAVMNGCTGLNQPILVMCQQAANFAPKSGACSGTGTW